MEQMGLFEEIEIEEGIEREKERVTQHQQSWKTCWDWDGPEMN